MSVAGPPAYHRLVCLDRGARWRLAVVVAAAVGAILAGTITAVVAVVLGARAFGDPDFAFDFNDGVDAAELFATNIGLALLVPIAALLYWAIYRRRIRWLSSTKPGLRWRWLLLCAGMALGVWALFLVLGTAYAAQQRETAVDLAAVAFLLVVVLTTPLQAAGEEYLFRGLLLQALGATRLPTWACCVLSGGLFATAHLQFDPPLFADRFLLGVVLGWLAIRTGGLEAGIAIHLVKNVSALVPAALIEDVGSTLDPSGVTWLPVGVDVVLLGLVVPWIVAAHRRREGHGQAQPSYAGAGLQGQA